MQNVIQLLMKWALNPSQVLQVIAPPERPLSRKMRQLPLRRFLLACSTQCKKMNLPLLRHLAGAFLVLKKLERFATEEKEGYQQRGLHVKKRRAGQTECKKKILQQGCQRQSMDHLAWRRVIVYLHLLKVPP